MRTWPAEPPLPASLFRATFAQPYEIVWQVAVDDTRLLVRASPQQLLAIGFDEIDSVGKGAYRQPYRPAGGMQLNRYRTGLMLHLKTEPDGLPASDRLHQEGRRLLLEWPYLHDAVIDYLPHARAEESVIDAPPGEFAAEIEPSSLTEPLIVIGLGLVVAFAFFWTADDRAAADRAEAAARQRRGLAVIERQGGTGIEWFGRPGYYRRASCWGFTAERLGGRAQGAYCETTHDRYVIWDSDRHTP